jgi:hypothetical protein
LRFTDLEFTSGVIGRSANGGVAPPWDLQSVLPRFAGTADQ